MMTKLVNEKYIYFPINSIFAERKIFSSCFLKLKLKRHFFFRFFLYFSGKISFRNLKRVAKELGENMTDEELQEMIGTYVHSAWFLLKQQFILKHLIVNFFLIFTFEFYTSWIDSKYSFRNFFTIFDLWCVDKLIFSIIYF